MTKKATREEIIEALADPENQTLEAAAESLGITPQALYERRRTDPSIEEEAAKVSRENTIRSVREGYRRLYWVITQGKPAEAIRAMELILRARGELEDKVKIDDTREYGVVILPAKRRREKEDESPEE